MGRPLGQLKLTNSVGENKKVKLSSDCIADIRWWGRYHAQLNGVFNQKMYKFELFQRFRPAFFFRGGGEKQELIIKLWVLNL